jgi:hypothetical protein
MNHKNILNMAKLFLPLLLTLALFGFLTSCTKTYKCTCVTSGIVNGVPISGSETEEIKAKKRSEAESACFAGNGSINTGGASITTACTLK